MFTGKVIGEIVSTINHPFYDGKKKLVVEKTDETGKPTKGYIIAVDSVGAGPGQQVLVLDEGNGSRQIWDSTDGPVRSTVVGIIDSIDIDTGE